jgi:hypothetical protein
VAVHLSARHVERLNRRACGGSLRSAQAAEAPQLRTAELELAPRLERDALAVKLGADDEVLLDDGLPAEPVTRRGTAA